MVTTLACSSTTVRERWFFVVPHTSAPPGCVLEHDLGWPGGVSRHTLRWAIGPSTTLCLSSIRSQSFASVCRAPTRAADDRHSYSEASLRHAFLITAYKNCDQVADLINVLSTDESHVFVHLDQGAAFSPDDVLARVRTRKSITMMSPRLRVQWGGYSHLAAILGLLRTARATGSFGYFHLLTGQCYPTKHLNEIFQFFEKNRGSEYLENFSLPTDRWDRGGLNRMAYYHLYDRLDAQKRVLGVRVNARIIDAIARLQAQIGLERELPGSFATYYGGSGYWSLSCDSIDFVLGVLDTTPDLEGRFRHTSCPEELLFQTLIMNSPLRNRVVGSNLRYIDWSYRNGSIPAVLDESDFERIDSSGALFARKLDPRLSQRLLALLKERIDTPRL